MKTRTQIALLISLLPTLLSFGQRQYSVAFYNVENLYDTVASGFYDDSDYTPDGRLRWTAQRYEQKISDVARVIDDMNADAVALSEVENEEVVRDLVSAMRQDYCYIHRSTSDSRGMDIALLYKADRFVPQIVEQLPSTSRREILHVKGEFYDMKVDIIAWHAPSMLNAQSHRLAALHALRRAADSLRMTDDASRLIVLADLNDAPDGATMSAAFGKPSKGVYRDAGLASYVTVPRNAGSYRYNGKWQLFDNILLDARLIDEASHIEGGVFIRNYMLVQRGKPLRRMVGRSYDRNIYTGGTSDHLPVYTIWRE